MPSVAYMNQSAPFWDFIASLEQQGANHPGQTQDRGHPHGENHDEGHEDEQYDYSPFGPWGWTGLFGAKDLPYRGPPHQHEAEQSGEKDVEKDAEKDMEKDDAEMRDGQDNGEGPSGASGSDNEGHMGRRGRHGHCGGRRGGRGEGGRHCGRGGHGHGHGHGGPGGWGRRGPPGWGGPGGPGGWGGPWGGPCGWGGPHGHHHRGPPPPPPHGHHHHPHGGPRGGFGRHGGGPWGRRNTNANPFGPSFDPSTFLTQLWEHFNPNINNNNARDTQDTQDAQQDHSPPADIFDTPSTYIIHVSLPGAKKDDIGITWDATTSSLCVAGVMHRPGDEELLKTLAMSERAVGAFERKVRLGTRAVPASVDAEGITARLEDGVLRVEVPKMEGEFVEVKRVDVE